MKTDKNRAICLVPGYFGLTGHVIKRVGTNSFEFDFFFDGYRENDKEGWMPVFKHEFLCPEIQGEKPQGINPNLFN
jgi:hypothetical protein